MPRVETRLDGTKVVVRIPMAPDLAEAILVGRTDQDIVLERLEEPLPASWGEQRDHFGC